MMTAATVHADDDASDAPHGGSGAEASPGGAASSATASNGDLSSEAAAQPLKKTALLARGFADDAGRAIGSLLPTASLQNITTRKYTLPDKTVASQVLMYRQLLHTKARPGLKLSRAYEGTPAQKAVMHMPWWEDGIEEYKKMVISYDNLITRLWLNGAIEPYQYQSQPPSLVEGDLLGAVSSENDGTEKMTLDVETFITENGLPPVPHQYWVDRLGFQQADPVTDFRSGGVLSLAMMVYMVESKPVICQRFFTGDTAVLPFGITCINVTDMIAKFLMLAKSTDRMDALLSQKPFWKMFGDPNAILAVQELAMSMLCDVAVELGQEKKIPSLARQTTDGMPGEPTDKVTVFDFSTILERTEKRVRDDLLGAGPKTVEELRSIAGRLRVKYQNQLERKIQRANQQEQYQKEGGGNMSALVPPPQIKGVMDMAGSMAGGFFAKVKSAKFPTSFGSLRTEEPLPQTTNGAPEASATIVDLPPLEDEAIINSPTPTQQETPVEGVDEGDWVGADMAAATDAISNFSIGDEDEEDPDLLL